MPSSGFLGLEPTPVGSAVPARVSPAGVGFGVPSVFL